MESEIKLLLIIIGIFLLILFINLYSSSPQPQQQQPKVMEGFTMEEKNIIQEMPIQQLVEEKPVLTQDSDSLFEEDDKTLEKKFQNKNQARGTYKKVSYAEGDRQSEFENEEYNEQQSMIKGDLGNKQNYAPFRPSGMKKEDEDIFDSNNYLPQEKNDDWFEVMPEPISVKNRHLINVSRPVGVNTIGTTLKNPSYDIRGTPACPKFVVSPWMQSSIEPDTNIKGLC